MINFKIERHLILKIYKSAKSSQIVLKIKKQFFFSNMYIHLVHFARDYSLVSHEFTLKKLTSQQKFSKSVTLKEKGDKMSFICLFQRHKSD